MPPSDTVGAGPPLLLTNARLADGRLVDIAVGPDGRIERVAEPTAADPLRHEVFDLAGRLVLPAAVEPHAHLDKALTADDAPNARGDLPGAIEAWHARWPKLTVDDMVARATAGAERSLANGITTIRTHVDLGPGIDLRAVEALVTVRERLADLVTIQIVALVTIPATGTAGATQRALLHDALGAGVDVVGGCPHLDPDPEGCIETLLDIAGAHARPVDLHVDETLEPHVLTLRALADRVARTGFTHGTTASHCVSLGIQPDAVQCEVAAAVAEAAVSVVALPQTNLFLQSRGIFSAPPRGLTAVSRLRDAGVNVAAGADNLQDPFNTMGRADPFETAALLVMAAHLTPEEAWSAVSTAARAALGIDDVAVAPGSRADLLAVPSATLRQAIADAPADRIVVRGGRVVARSTSSTTLADR